jgi:tetratricopeptide (TPR) repeat protein
LENILQNFNDGFEPAVNETAQLMVTFANLVIRTGDYVYAEELHIRAIDILAQEMGRAHPLIEPVRQDLSRIYDRHYRVLVAEGRQAEARAVAVRCTDLYTDWLEAVRALPTGNYRVSQEMIQGVRSVAYAMAALYPQAEAEFQSMVRRQELGLAVGQTDLIPQLMPAFIATVGWTQYLNGQFSEAEVTMRKALGDAEARQLTDELVYYRVLGMLGAIVAAQRRFEEAEELLQKAYQGNLQFPGQGAEAAGMVGFNIPRFLSEETHGLRLIALYESWGKADKAAEWREKVANTPPTFGAP